MVKKKTKFEITIEKLSIKYEGENEEEVRQVQVGVNRLLESLTHTSNQLMDVEEGEYEDVPAATAPDDNSDKNETPKSKEVKRRAPRDSTRSKQILVLKQEGYFQEKRELSEIRKALSNKGFNFESKEIASAMVYLTQKGDLQREKQAGKFVYWSSNT
jgi:hypothetical protein